MSSLLSCFSLRRRRESSDNHSDNRSHDTDKDKKKKGPIKCCKCNCKCHNSLSNETDGKGFSKTLRISEKSRHSSFPCCESSSSVPSNASTPTASVDPNGMPFFIHKTPTSGEGGLHGHGQSPPKSYMPVSKDDPFYNMNHPRRGKAVIFNFDRWNNTNIPHLELSPRLGSKKDRDDLFQCFQKLGFEAASYDNLKHLEMWAHLEEIRKEDHSDADCLVIVLMTHGEKNTVYMTDGTQIPINLIWENFEAHNCPSLAGKPKIFIVQACRGKRYDSGTKLLPPLVPSEGNEQDLNFSDVTDSSTFSYVIPNAADILVAFSCPLGHYSWRHPERGSWFIQAIVKVFNEKAYELNLQELFTRVAREVALNYKSSTTSVESNNKRQVTSTSSTLIRTVVFKPKAVWKTAHAPIPISTEANHAITIPTVPVPVPPPGKDEEPLEEEMKGITLISSLASSTASPSNLILKPGENGVSYLHTHSNGNGISAISAIPIQIPISDEADQEDMDSDRDTFNGPTKV